MLASWLGKLSSAVALYNADQHQKEIGNNLNSESPILNPLESPMHFVWPPVDCI